MLPCPIISVAASSTHRTLEGNAINKPRVTSCENVLCGLAMSKYLHSRIHFILKVPLSREVHKGGLIRVKHNYKIYHVDTWMLANGADTLKKKETTSTTQDEMISIKTEAGKVQKPIVNRPIL